MGYFKILFEKNERVIKSYTDYMIDYYKYNKKKEYWLNPKNKDEKKKNDEKVKREWFEKILELAKNGKFIDYKTLTDLKNIGLFDELIEKIPDGNFDKKGMR